MYAGGVVQITSDSYSDSIAKLLSQARFFGNTMRGWLEDNNESLNLLRCHPNNLGFFGELTTSVIIGVFLTLIEDDEERLGALNSITNMMRQDDWHPLVWHFLQGFILHVNSYIKQNPTTAYDEAVGHWLLSNLKRPVKTGDPPETITQDELRFMTVIAQIICEHAADLSRIPEE